MMTKRPNGSRTQRAKRHLAEARRAALHSLADGRRQATEVIRTRRVGALVDRVRDWAMNRVATVVARSIERTTWKVALESRKLTFDGFVVAMQTGGALTRMARQ